MSPKPLKCPPGKNRGAEDPQADPKQAKFHPQESDPWGFIGPLGLLEALNPKPYLKAHGT